MKGYVDWVSVDPFFALDNRKVIGSDHGKGKREDSSLHVVCRFFV